MAGKGDLGGTMRLGAYPAMLAPGSLVAEAYGRPTVTERHRHRYEVNNAYRDALAKAGLHSPARRPTGGWSSSSRWTASCTRSSWRPRRIRSSRAARPGRTRCSPGFIGAALTYNEADRLPVEVETSTHSGPEFGARTGTSPVSSGAGGAAAGADAATPLGHAGCMRDGRRTRAAASSGSAAPCSAWSPTSSGCRAGSGGAGLHAASGRGGGGGPRRRGPRRSRPPVPAPGRGSTCGSCRRACSTWPVSRLSARPHASWPRRPTSRPAAGTSSSTCTRARATPTSSSGSSSRVISAGAPTRAARREHEEADMTVSLGRPRRGGGDGVSR